MYHQGSQIYTIKTLITLPLKFTFNYTIYYMTLQAIKQQDCNHKETVPLISNFSVLIKKH